MQSKSLKGLAVFTTIFFFASNLSGTFITIYFRDLGLSIPEIVMILAVTFAIIGLLPLVLLRAVKNFERIISFGVLFTMLFYIALICVKQPIFLGLAYGLGIATFWPSFNLLQFRLSETKIRARTVSFFSVVIPSLTSIIGPAVGGFIIQSTSFAHLFTMVIALYFAAFLLSLKMRFESKAYEFQIPKERKIVAFFVTFIFWGLIESYWVAYPFFVYKLSGNVLYMGFVYSATSVVVTLLNFMVNWVSDIKLTRIKYAAVGATLNALWYFAVAYSSSVYQIVALSILSGLAGAFSLSWFAYYGDSFEREYHATILVMMETGLMVGRLINLAPTYVFITGENYTSYFALLGAFALILIPIFVLFKSRIDKKQTV